MKLVLAKMDDLDSVYDLYESVKDKKFCVWDSEYPTKTNIEYDFKHECLYVLKSDLKVIGAISINYEKEFDNIPDAWLCTKNSCEIARVVVDHTCQNKGLGEFMINEICKILSIRGINSIHLAVAVNNLPAVKLYEKCGFLRNSTIYMFENYYYLYEKKL